MVSPLPWPCSSCSIMVSPSMTISLFWNKRPSIATPRYSMSSSGVFLCLDLVSTTVKMTGVDGTVNRKKAKYRNIIHHNLRGIIESRPVLCGVFNRGPLRPSTASSERYWTFLILSAIELLPIWIMFIDCIIDRIWISTVTLTTELLNLAQIEPCCGVIMECDSLLTA